MNYNQKVYLKKQKISSEKLIFAFNQAKDDVLIIAH